MKLVCELCGWVYDEAAGDEKRGIPAGTGFDQLPAYFECPSCGSEKEAFCPVERRPVHPRKRQDDRTFWQEIKYSQDSGASQR